MHLNGNDKSPGTYRLHNLQVPTPPHPTLPHTPPAPSSIFASNDPIIFLFRTALHEERRSSFYTERNETKRTCSTVALRNNLDPSFRGITGALPSACSTTRTTYPADASAIVW